MEVNAPTNKTWLITGASAGLGLQIALSALREGHRVIGTGRNINRAAIENPDFGRLGGIWLQLDVSKPEVEQILKQAVAREEDQGPVHWVVVNNAGQTLLGTVEDMSDGQISDYLQTNLFGFVRVWRALLSTMRRHRTGTLVSVSSIWGFIGKPEHMMYSAAKATIESLTESYADLLAPFGIKTMIIEPGGFRTKFPGNHIKADGGVTEDYRARVQDWTDLVDTAARDPTLVNGDPQRFGAKVVDAVEGRGLFEELWSGKSRNEVVRVQLGSDSYTLFGDKLKKLNEDYARMEEIASSTDVVS